MFWEMTNSIIVMWDRDPNQTLIVKVNFQMRCAVLRTVIYISLSEGLIKFKHFLMLLYFQTQVTPNKYKFIPYSFNEQGQILLSDDYGQNQVLFKKKFKETIKNLQPVKR